MLTARVRRVNLPLAAAWLLLRRLLYAAFVVVLVTLASALATAVVPRLLGYGTLVVQGASMGDAAPVGSLVIARWTEAGDVAPGDVILIREEREDTQLTPKLHRVVSLDSENGNILVRTKGDANETVDPNLYILPDRVLMPAFTVPNLGYVAGFAMSPLGWVSLVLLPAAVLALLVLRSIWADEDEPGAEPGTL